MVAAKFNAREADYDVVTIGDSSGLMGIYPEYIEQELQGKLRIGNLSLIGYVGKEGYDLTIENNIKINKPKLIVLYISSNNPEFNYKYSSTYERALIVFRYGTLIQIVKYISTNLEGFEKIISRIVSMQYSINNDTYRQSLNKLQANHGFMANNGPHMREDCSPESAGGAYDKNYLLDLKNKYRDMGYNFKIYLAPSPICESNFLLAAEQFAGIIDNTPYQMPSHLFVDREHPTPEGAKANAKHFATFVAASLGQQLLP